MIKLGSSYRHMTIAIVFIYCDSLCYLSREDNIKHKPEIKTNKQKEKSLPNTLVLLVL